MSKPHGIIIFGANGSGKTTLGRELANILNFKHIDHEEYCFEKSEIPYTVERPFAEYTSLMLADIERSRGFVLTATTGNFGEKIQSLYDLAIRIEAPPELCIERVKQRSIDNFGDRARKGGDMYEQEKRFVDFVAKRPLSRIDDWAKTLACPVIRVDGTVNYKQTAADIANRFYTKPGEPWRVYTAVLGELKIYRFTIIFARYNGEWLYIRHKDRDTYETAGGHIEPGETPLDCAKRELYEETGAVKFSIFPAFDYAVHTDTEFSYGQVFYADVHYFTGSRSVFFVNFLADFNLFTIGRNYIGKRAVSVFVLPEIPVFAPVLYKPFLQFGFLICEPNRRRRGAATRAVTRKKKT